MEEKVHFPIHVESGPRITEWPVQELTKAHVETIDLELGLYRSQQSLKSLSAEEKARFSEAQRLERTVNPSSVLLAEGMEPILQSGQFSVSGTVYFRSRRCPPVSGRGRTGSLRGVCGEALDL